MKPSAPVKSIAYAALTTLSLSFLSQVSLESPRPASTQVLGVLPSGLTNGWGMLWVFLFVLLLFFYRHQRFSDRRLRRPCAALAIILGACTLLGVNLRYNNTLNFFTHSLPRTCITLLCIAGVSVLLRVLLECLLDALAMPPRAPYPIETRLLDCHARSFSFLCIFLCTLPYLIAFYPGTVHWDALWQLNFFTGAWRFTTHHPPVSTLLMGVCLRTGQALGSDNLGIFCYVLPQCVLSALLLSSVLVLLCDLRAPYPLRWLTLGFFSLFPLFPIYAVTLIKDTGFALASLGMSVLALRLFALPDTFTKGRWALLALAALCMSLFRNNGLAQVALCALAFLLLTRTRRARLSVALSLGSAAVVSLLCTQLIVSALGALPGSAAEALSIPLQQSARTALLYPEDVTDAERDAIDALLPYDRLAASYLPEKADGVKSIVRADASRKAYASYFSAWLAQLVRHPFTYIEATLNNTYGYLYPDRTHSLDGLGYYAIEQTEGVNLHNLDLHFIPGFNRVRYRLEQFSRLVADLPVLGMLYSCGAHVWALLIAACALICAKRMRLLGALIPAFTCVLVCFASPVNAYIRYMLPVIYALPLTLACAMHALKKEDHPT